VDARPLDSEAQAGDRTWPVTLWYVGPLIAYCALIFYLSHQSFEPVGEGRDKVIHILVYSGTGFLAFRSFLMLSGAPGAHIALAAIAFGVLYGLSDEWHQSFVPRREASLLDVIADGVGSVIGAFVAWGFFLWRRPERLVRRGPE
jgi:VanZ family protein